MPVILLYSPVTVLIMFTITNVVTKSAKISRVDRFKKKQSRFTTGLPNDKCYVLFIMLPVEIQVAAEIMVCYHFQVVFG